MRETQSADGRVRRCLETWGEIAAHLNVEIRTAQRWERKIGLPVRRLEGSQAVYAYADDLDRWRESRETRSDEDGTDRALPKDMDVRSSVPPAPYVPLPAGSWPPAVKLLLVAGAAVLVLATSAYVAKSWPTTREPVTLAVEGQRLIATDSSGGMVWTHRFDLPTRQADTKYRYGLSNWWDRVDVDGDGVDEIFAVVSHPVGDDEHREALHCLSLDGRLKFSYFPEFNLTFEQASFSGPWRFWDIEVVPNDRSIWVALESVAMWPSVVVRLAADGASSLRFVQPGLIVTLESTEIDGRLRLLAGGVNNEYAAASLASIDLDGDPATAPQRGSGPFTCRNCPTGQPATYALFRPSPLNHLLGLPYNQVISIAASRGQITVGSLEALGDNFSALVTYALDANLKAVRATPSDAYWTWKPRVGPWRGRVGHPAALPSRSWTGGAWTQVQVPIAGQHPSSATSQ